MKTPIATLLERAAVALPPQKPSRSVWSTYYPVIKALVGNGHSVMSAVDWLIGQGEIKPVARLNAYRAIHAMHKRQTSAE